MFDIAQAGILRALRALSMHLATFGKLGIGRHDQSLV